MIRSRHHRSLCRLVESPQHEAWAEDVGPPKSLAKRPTSLPRFATADGTRQPRRNTLSLFKYQAKGAVTCATSHKLQAYRNSAHSANPQASKKAYPLKQQAIMTGEVVSIDTLRNVATGEMWPEATKSPQNGCPPAPRPENMWGRRRHPVTTQLATTPKVAPRSNNPLAQSSPLVATRASSHLPQEHPPAEVRSGDRREAFSEAGL